MTPAAIIEKAKEDGVELSLSQAGSVKMIGKEEVVEKWLPTIRENKAELLRLLTGGYTDTKNTASSPLPPWCKVGCPCLEDIPGTGIGCLLPLPDGGEKWLSLAAINNCPNNTQIRTDTL